MSSQQPKPHWTVRTVIIFAGTIALIANLIAIFVFVGGRSTLQSFANSSGSTPTHIPATPTPTHIPATPTPTFPRLKGSYSGNYTIVNNGYSRNLSLLVQSNDQRGNVTIAATFEGSVL